MKNKLERFRIVAERENVLERGKDIFLKIKGKWCSDYFKTSETIKKNAKRYECCF